MRATKRALQSLSRRVAALERELGGLKQLAAEPLVQRSRSLPPGTPLAEVEFRVCSQFGEDGILQHLTAHVPCASKSFVEFGVEDFREANCRFLIERDPWTGLVLDGDPELEKKLRKQAIYALRDLRARSAFVDCENINDLLRGSGFSGEIGILSIDIDGNDYWVWKAIDCVSPSIVIVEYNSVFGCERSVTIPYDPSFVRQQAHPSWLYLGASLPALVALGKEKGYGFVGSNSAGNNAFFVRRDLCGSLKLLEAREGYVESAFRESRGPDGKMDFLGGADRRRAIAEMPVVDVETGETIRVGELG